MSTQVETFRVSLQEAEVYVTELVPLLFARWADLVVDAAGVGPGQAVLDVACGTGIVARTAARRLGGTGSVVGLDVNEAMLAVAGRLAPDIGWRLGDAAELPFPAEAFDVVLCQSGLMFFPDPVQALREMRRVVRRDGVVAVQAWSGLDAQPAYRSFYEIIDRRAGAEAVQLVNAYFCLGDLTALTDRLRAAGLDVTGTHTQVTGMRLPGVDALVAAEVQGTPLGARITDKAYAAILADARVALGRYCDESGALEMPIEGVVITARPA